MKICIPKEGALVSQHFGHTPEFAIFTVEDGKVLSKEVVQSPGHEPGKLPRLMSSYGVTHVITGGMGRKAQQMFEELNIKVFSGASGEIDEVLKSFLNGTLKTGQNLCDH
jgi:predicted Fe-Mo cluster-binding NifX family protein